MNLRNLLPGQVHNREQELEKANEMLDAMLTESMRTVDGLMELINATGDPELIAAMHEVISNSKEYPPE